MNLGRDAEAGFVQDFDVEVQARFLSWSLVTILPLIFCSGYEVES